MRSGLVLLELLLVMAIAAILAAIATPSLLSLSDSAAVRTEAIRAVAAFDAARGGAIRLGTVATLVLTDTAYRVTTVVGTDTVMAWHQPGPSRSGVSISGVGQPIAFGPDGLAVGVANRTLLIGKGSALRRVVISRLGRVTY